MNIFVIYDHPEDYPEHFVVREQTISEGKFISYGMPTLAATLEEAGALKNKKDFTRHLHLN